jgi:isocitrate/isopropylmalate dehydrogenase
MSLTNVSYGGSMSYKIGLIPGDGIGREVVPEGVRMLEALGRRFGFDPIFKEFPYKVETIIRQDLQDRQDFFVVSGKNNEIFVRCVGQRKNSAVSGLYCSLSSGKREKIH